jgi:hypothetical protein
MSSLCVAGPNFITVAVTLDGDCFEMPMPLRCHRYARNNVFHPRSRVGSDGTPIRLPAIMKKCGPGREVSSWRLLVMEAAGANAGMMGAR